MGRFGERPLRVDRIGLAGSNAVRFQVTIRHGMGTRRIDVDVSAREILAIADAIRATANQACTAPRSRTAHPSDGLSVGHAIWHLDNPENPMPCITGDVIDVESDDGRPAQDLLLRGAAQFGDAAARVALEGDARGRAPSPTPRTEIGDEQIDHLAGLALRERNDELFTVARWALRQDHQIVTEADVTTARRLCLRFWNDRARRDALGDHP